MRPRWIVLLLSLALAGCPTEEPAPEGPPVAPPAGQIELDTGGADPDVLDLGEAFPGEVRAGAVTVWNVGEGALSLEAPVVGAPFALVQPQSFTPLLEPGQSTTIEVEYSPAQDESVEATLVVASADLGVEERQVTLRAEGLAPLREIEPASHDFGNLGIGCEASQELVLSNAGRAPVELYDLVYEDLAATGELSLVNLNPVDGDPETIDFVLNPGDEAVVTVHYAPQDVDADSGILHVLSNTPGEPVDGTSAQQIGAAHVGAAWTDTFTQAASDDVDLLVVIDDSVSMADKLTAVVNGLGAMFQVLESLEYDYQVAVTTTDPMAPGVLAGQVPIVRPSTPDPAGEFLSNANVGTGGSSPEQGFHSAWVALEAAADGLGDHAGFLRDGASLQLLFISDAQEQSTAVMGWGWQDYVDAFRGYEELPQRVGMAAVTGGVAGCSGAIGSAGSGSDYVLAAEALDGVTISICDPDWVSPLSSWLWGFDQPVDTFFLTEQPVPESLDVRLNGVPIATGWTYDSALNALVFDVDHVPEDQDTVTVDYSVLEDCWG